MNEDARLTLLQDLIQSLNDPILDSLVYSPDFREFLISQGPGLTALVRQSILDLFRIHAYENGSGQWQSSGPDSWPEIGDPRFSRSSRIDIGPQDGEGLAPAVSRFVSPSMTLEGSNQPVMKSVPVERSMPSSKIASEIEAPTAPYSEDTIRQIIVDLIEEATGYPRDMIGLDKSLDRDLRIDSIKRKELLAQVQKKLGLSPITDDAFWEDESVNSLSKKLFKLITG